VCGSGVLVCSSSLLIRRHQRARCQAETPLIDLFKCAEPALTRIRNEALIFQGALDYVGRHVDAKVAYDDGSTDRTLEILGGHPRVALIVANRSWEADIEGRRIAEGRHRGLLLQIAREHFRSSGCFASIRTSALPEICAGSWNKLIPAFATACEFNYSTPI
jgi:hypothetical protein